MLNPKRKIDFYGDHFMNFFEPLDKKVKLRISKTLFLITYAEWVPEKHLKHLTGTNGLYEIRINSFLGTFRIFCCFSNNNELMLFNGFKKKTMKTPSGELELAKKLMNEYKSKKK